MSLNHGAPQNGVRRPDGERECPKETLPALASLPQKTPDPGMVELSRIRRLLQADLNAAIQAWAERLKISADSPIKRKFALAKLREDARQMSMCLFPAKPHVHGHDAEARQSQKETE